MLTLSCSVATCLLTYTVQSLSKIFQEKVLASAGVGAVISGEKSFTAWNGGAEHVLTFTWSESLYFITHSLHCLFCTTRFFLTEFFKNLQKGLGFGGQRCCDFGRKIVYGLERGCGARTYVYLIWKFHFVMRNFFALWTRLCLACELVLVLEQDQEGTNFLNKQQVVDNETVEHKSATMGSVLGKGNLTPNNGKCDLSDGKSREYMPVDSFCVVHIVLSEWCRTRMSCMLQKQLCFTRRTTPSSYIVDSDYDSAQLRF